MELSTEVSQDEKLTAFYQIKNLFPGRHRESRGAVQYFLLMKRVHDTEPSIHLFIRSMPSLGYKSRPALKSIFSPRALCNLWTLTLIYSSYFSLARSLARSTETERLGLTRGNYFRVFDKLCIMSSVLVLSEFWLLNA